MRYNFALFLNGNALKHLCMLRRDVKKLTRILGFTQKNSKNFVDVLARLGTKHALLIAISLFGNCDQEFLTKNEKGESV